MGQNKKRQESVNNLKIKGMFYCNKNKTKVLKIQLLDKNIGILSNHWLICPNKQVIGCNIVAFPTVFNSVNPSLWN